MVVDPEYIGARPVRVAERFADLLAPARGSRILDWGAGSGIFAGEMARRGFTAESYDPFSAPNAPVGKFDIITCIEVDRACPRSDATPSGSMTEHLADGGMIIVGETLQPDDIERIRCSWWYVAPRNGHCSTFDRRTLATIRRSARSRVSQSRQPVGRTFCIGLNRVPCAASRRAWARRSPTFAWARPAPRAVGGTGWNALKVGRPSNGVPPLNSHGTSLCRRDRSARWSSTFRYVHVIADFIGGCKLRIAGSVGLLNVRNHTIAGELADVEPGPVRVTLETPPLARARGAGNRMIGIALRVCTE